MLSFTAFRIIALLEGVSFLLLLGVAMPLKYIYMTPLAVQVIGPIHGLLFMLFCAYLIMILKRHTLPAKVGVWGFLAGILPFGTLVFDGYIKKKRGRRWAGRDIVYDCVRGNNDPIFYLSKQPDLRVMPVYGRFRLDLPRPGTQVDLSA